MTAGVRTQFSKYHSYYYCYYYSNRLLVQFSSGVQLLDLVPDIVRSWHVSSVSALEPGPGTHPRSMVGFGVGQVDKVATMVVVICVSSSSSSSKLTRAVNLLVRTVGIGPWSLSHWAASISASLVTSLSSLPFVVEDEIWHGRGMSRNRVLVLPAHPWAMIETGSWLRSNPRLPNLHPWDVATWACAFGDDGVEYCPPQDCWLTQTSVGANCCC